ncbi:MAG: DUF2723 domain-containing protein [Anaerolineae bacterium]|nr:DUF2723 domain-containing protein [Anaerolineae bacterium]
MTKDLLQALDSPQFNKTDYWIALAVGICGLVMYVRTLAPDVLYGDSAEFQALTYTLGTTHSTGYPIYLLLARLLGFLPIASLAWRVNLLSAVSAATTLSAVFLLTRYLTCSRIGAALGSAALGLSYTFWSQAVIAEVYTPALAFLSVILLLLWRWHNAPTERNRALLFAALLSSLGLGVHASVVLLAPTAVVFVIGILWLQRLRWPQWWRPLRAALVGVALGVGFFMLASLATDINDPPSSFLRVAIYPSRSIWGLEITDLDSPFERLWVTITGRQWQDAMFPQNVDAAREIFIYIGRLLSREFSIPMLLCAVLGVAVLLRTKPELGLFWMVTFITILFFILNYQPPDKYIFYLPTYLLVAMAIGCGAGSLLEWAHRRLAAAPLYLLVLALAVLTVVWPSVTLRWQALRDGAATFVREDYAYPIDDLEEPRRRAARKIENLPENAMVISDWRALYTMVYLAHVEQMRPDITIMEASPHGGEGMVADTLIQVLEKALQEGRPVFADRVYGNLRDHFRVLPASGGQWYRLSLPKTD